MSDETTTSNEEATTTIVDAQQPRTATQQAEIDYQQQGFTLALVDYDRERCVYREIEERAEVSPRKAAIAYRGRELSYGGLNAQANQVARYLVRMGVGKGDLVGVFMRRTPQMVAAMLGVWKAGAGYVPLDPQYPPERLRAMLHDAEPKVIITTNSLRERVDDTLSTILCVDEEREQIEEESPENLDEVLSSGQVAYVIYTAGSTGAPKGVMLAHQSVMSLVTWAKSAFQPEELEGVLAAASIGSDLSIFELWATLGCGGTVVLADDLMDWWEHIDDEDAHPVRLINTRPSAMTKLMQQGSLPKSARTVNLTGEVLNTGLVGQLTKAGDLKQVNNLYGQSETTTYSTWTTVGAGDKVTIGRAVANTQLYVLDEEMQLVPGGVAGELYVGGDGLALGYLKNFRLTAERFLPNPFSQGNGSRMYRTGDVVRWQEDGQLEYLSRADQQVRLGGYRIKLEEIEAAVLDHAGVSQAVVVARVDQTGVKRLMGYVVGRGKKIDVGRLRGYLQQRLPEYMVPSAFQQLDSLPLTPNGKIDRKALAELESGEAIEETSAPVLTPTEELITGVWSSLLGKSNIGRDDNFFDLGGHSLLVTQVISRIREVFQVELPLQVMFESPTVAGLARSIESSTRIEAPPLRRRSRQERIPLSFAQERMWFLSRYELETSLYNVPVAMRVRGALNVEAAKASLQEMVHRHEALRTSFPEVGDSTIQDIAVEMEVPFAVAEIREDELDGVLREQARRSFDLSHGPLIRASLFRIGSQDHVLLVVTHHIVSDGWSLGVMLREFNALYDSFSRGAASPLPPLPIQYADYSEWQREWLQGEVLEKQLDYWRKQLAGHETLRLPTDRPHSAKPTLAGTMETSRLPESLVSQLKLLSDQQGVTLFMTLLAGFEILLYRYTGQTDISVGSGIANRNRQELEPLIGFFVNTLVLRTRFTEDSSVAELLQRVREVSLQAYAHQDIPFERLVEALDPVRELSRTPFFQALFVLQNAPLPTVSWDGLEATASIVETGTAKFDLTLSAREEDGELELSLEYRTELFNAERMKRLLQHYGTLLEGIAVSVDARISELEILSEPERQQLLVEWKRTEAQCPLDKCIQELFEEQAAKTPQAVAVVDGDRQISYEELNRRANQLAHYLARLGVGPEVRVGICMERGLEMMAGVLGVLKAGGAYVPLDPADPSARRSCMVKDAGAKFVLTNERFTQQMAGCAEHVVDLEEAREEIEKQSGDNLKVHLDAENLAWVIYTSSSAGRPRGTAIPHCSAVSMLQRTLIDAMDQNPSVERWLNLYGLAEDTTYATYAEVKLDEQGAVTIGRSLSNPQAYVLDGHMKLVPVGIKGELYMSGSGQARGYLNRPELTAEKFVPNPFGKTGGERLYRTGDLVRYQENGNLEFLGRLDSQVKIQGRRIEPGEIEAALFDYPGVTQAAVIAREDEPGNVRLVGYVASSERLDVDRLRSHLQQRVPEYMVPAALLQLDTLPLTASGKVDRKALIELESKEAMEAGSLALTPTEELIAGVWSGLLGKSDIRRDDNFFNLGGHSLTVIQMLARLEQVFHREIELRAVFEFPVLKDFSAYVDRLTGPAQQATDRPILPASRDGDLPLSFAQQRLWFLAQMEGGSAAYHVPFGLHLKGDLDRTALGRALDRIVVRHEVLRTTFAFHDGEPVQEIGAVEQSSFRLIEHDLRGHNDVETELAALSELEAGASFDLEAGPLIRGRLIRLAEDEHVLLVTMHHIVSDGWSMGVMAGELKALYGAFVGGEADPLPALEIQYADYAVWQRQWIEGEILQQQAAYWKTTLAGAPALLELPTDHTRPVQQDFAGGFVELVLDEQLTAGLKDLSRRHGTTLYMTLLAGWAILLARLSGQQDVVIGSPVANRGRAEIENLIGFFVNTLALRLDLSGSPSVSELLQQTKAQSLAAQRHQDIPFEQVVELAQPVRSLAHSPLFQVMFAWQNATDARLELPGLEAQPLPLASYRVAKFDLTLSLQEVGERIVGELEYATALYERSTVERYREYFLRLVEAMVADDAQPIDRLPMVSEGEREQVLYEWNETKAEFPSGKCVQELFEEQVRRSPEATALVLEDASLSYEELNARANRLAHYLRALGVKPEERVAICVERGFEMIVGLLAILKAGGGYVPLDPAYPEERLQYMLEDSAPVVLLTQRHLQDRFSGMGDSVPVLDLNATAWQSFSESNPDADAVGLTSSHLAYVIYTSGSTGQPKGVMVEHRGLCNISLTQSRELKVEPSSRILQFASFSFDACAWETLMALCQGAALYLLPQKCLVAGDNLIETAARDGITHATLPPTVLAGMSERAHVDSLRVLMVGGEAVPGWIAERWGRGRQLINAYGPTETTICTAMHRCVAEESGKPPIGRPITNTRIYILDSNREPVPVGVVGEMYVGGVGVARGYLKRPELTAERFVADPFVEEWGARMYRTGDLGRWRKDGAIEFVGRNDNQVKIRGFRIELGEIEARLMEHAEVKEAVVLAREDTAGEKRLVAYYTCRESSGGVSESSVERVGAEQLRAHLSAFVPDYMVPAAYVRMERLPLTPSGKLDRKALPAPEQEAYAVRGYEEPQGEMEMKLAEVWAEVLKLEKVGRHDNFFYLGGHSLLAVRAVSRLQQVLSVEVAIRDLFVHAELADLARHLQGAAHAELSRIMPAQRSGRLPLSFAQQRLWFLAQMEGASEAYHIPFGLHLKGDLDRTALRRALDRIVVRHEALRTTFAFLDGEPVQEIGAVEASSFRLLEHDLRGHNDVAAELAALGELEAGASFDLEAGPLIRGRLIRLAEDEHVLLVTMHHIVSDGWSMGVMVGELKALYGAFLGGEADPLPELEIQYADYAVWQRQWIEGEILQQQAAYWKTTLAGAPALLALPMDRVRPVEQSYAGAALPVVLEEKLTSGLKGLSRRHGTTLYMTLLAGWAILLARLSGQQDVVIGSPVANRGRTEIENLIGFFVNTLALRLDLSGSPSVRELLQQAKAQSLAAQRHQDIPFEQVVELAQPVRSLAHSPLFQMMFAWQNAVESSLELPGLALLPLQSPHKVAQFDLTLSLREEEETIVGGIEYATSLFEPATIERYLGYFRTLLEAMVADNTQAVHRLSMLPESERHQLLYEWNDTKTEYPADKCVHQLFEEQAAQRPEAVAVVFEDQELTYEDLNLRANQLGNYLVKLGVGPEVRVGVCMERSPEMVVGLLGVLKAGGAYVPLDPVYPVDRLTYMVQDAKIEVLLTQSKFQQRLPDYAGRLIEFDVDWELIAGESGSSFVSVSKVIAENLAYVIYTSGSTGKPKGVAVEHCQVCNQLFWAGAALSLGSADRVLQKASFSFDASILEIFLPLARGAQIIIAKPGRERDVDYLVRLVIEKAVTYVDLVPALLEQMLEHPTIKQWTSLRVMSSGAEILKPELVSAFYRFLSGVLWNTYGPTEATVQSTFTACTTEEGQSVPIGRPIANTQIYILDSYMQPVPQGVTGELCIGGGGVARGYLNQDELTAERFVADGFSGTAGARLYRTGDLGRWLADGNIDFVGRNDNQVKVRGFRIELGEIEARLAEHPEVRQTVVLAREDTVGEKRLVAYYTCRESSGGVSESSVESVGAEQLRAHLSAVLPDYMVPAAYMRMESLPLTPNGKLDRKALPAPEQKAYAVRGYEASQGELETKLAEVWAEVLKLEKVGRHDNFFELGGHSLLAVRAVSRLQQVLSVEVAVRDLFVHPELADLARHLQGAAHAELSRIMPAQRSGRLPLSFAQQRLWFLAQMEGASEAYHIPFGLHLKGDLDRTALRRALDRIVVRHEVLRTTFAFHDGEPVQEIGAVEQSSFRLIEHDLRGHNDVETELAALSELEAGASFDLEAGPLIRGRLIRLAEDEHVLLVTMHHIVSDGWSMGVMAGELKALYGAFVGGEADPLPALEIQYADYAVWQRQWIEGEILQQQAAYWKTTLAGAPALLELPTDHTRPVQQDFAGGFVELVLDEQLTAGLKDLSRRHGTTLYMTLLAGWAILLARLSGQQDVVIGSPVANRGRAEIENLIGFFVNTLALRLDLSGSPSVRELLEQAKAQSLAVQRHQDIPFEQVVELAQPVRSLAHSPLFQVMFAWQNVTDARLELPGLEVQPLPLASYRMAKFDLTLSLQEVGERIVGELEYATALYERSTVERYREYFLRLVEAMVADDTQAVDHLRLLTETERHQALYEWNATEREYPRDKCVHELFEEQVRRSSQATAVAFEEEELSYGELNARANRLAHYLRALGVKPDERVAICVERSFEMVVGLLGILKAGGAYLPLDPSYPRDRLAYVLEDGQVSVLLTQERFRSQFSGYSGRVLALDEQWNEVAIENDTNLQNITSLENLVYVIYTSGSTGQPKGAMNVHAGLCNRLRWMQQQYGLDANDRVLQKTPFTFDVSVWEFFWPLLTGARLVMAQPGGHQYADYLSAKIQSSRITTLHFVPAMLKIWLESEAVERCTTLKRVICSGEALSVEAQKKFYSKLNVELHNLYGPTEASIDVTYWPCQDADSRDFVPIGGPIANTQVYVLDRALELVPTGVKGELYLGGVGLARGYLARPDLTAEKFVPHPFSQAGGGRLYRTGDEVRWRGKGELEYFGRLDNQVKLRGFRIELGEIEARLQEYDGVSESVVVVREDTAGDKRLVAYVVPDKILSSALAEPKELVAALRVHLSGKLPEYMVPNAFVFLPSMPLTSNGKIDRKALPAVKSTPKSSGQANLPLRHTERILTDIWTRILKIDEVGVEEKFFDVGGHSLLIPGVRLAVQKAFGTDLPIVDFFQYPTIRSLAERLDATRSVPEVKPLSRDKTVKAEQPRSGTKGFAIVGVACRFQDAANVEEFWHNLQGGVESITDFTKEELRAAGVSEELIASSDYVKRGSVVANTDLFDARFFDISAREAEMIDPQQRIFLECAWEALENAGYAVKNYPGKIGLYAGSSLNTYFLNLLAEDGSLYSKDAAGLFFGNAKDFLATRVSYKLDLTGPSVTVQTACSTSLVAVHMACRALLNHECDMAMAGGITIPTPQKIGDIFQEGGIISRDGHCRPFDERAQGTVKGAGGGIVVIKRLEDALRDGDHILAVIKGSAINNDGGNKVGYTAPSITGQCNVIQEALLESGVRPETITYLEAHGTATALGDPIEVSALTQAYRGAGTENTGFCAIGSVKSNIGHADAAAGIAGLIKTVLSLEHKLIPPTVHFERPNPKIDFANSPFYVNATLSEWKTNGVPRRAGVSSFGIGGTNAHVIVEEAPSNDFISVCRLWQLVLLSAKTATALETAADNLNAYFQKHDSVNLADVAHTLQVGRASLAHRCFVVGKTVADTAEALQHRRSKSLANSIVPREACRIAFLFPGQGSQYVNMGKHLYAHEPLFHELVDQCSELLQPSLQLDLRSVLYPSAEKYLWAEAELRETRTTQPALFVIEYALARVWMSWGLQPESMVGHSIGEYVAACLAGVFSLEDALNLVALRGRLMHSCERGGMLAVAASEEEVQPYLKMGLELAAINGSRSCILTGPLDSLELAEKELVQQQVIHRRLQSSHAFHSSMMEPIVGQFANEVQKVRLNGPRMRYLSNLTGDWITAEQATDPVYWGKQLRGTVQFAQALRSLFSGTDRLALEVGPGHSNSTAIRQTIAKPSLPVMLSSLPDANTEESDVKQMLTALGQLWLHGADVDWNAFASGEKRRRIPLPTYPFERERYWVDSPASRQSRPDTSRRKLTDWLYLPSWKEARRVALSAESEVEENSTVLVFGGNSAMAEKLALRLEQKRYGIVTVVAGREFARIDHRTYAINPTSRSNYEALFSVLREQGQLPKKILHLWNVSQNESVEQDLDFALYSPLHLVQAATAEPGIGPIQCMIVSSGLHKITGNESLSPAKATLLGLCKTIPWELPDFACKSVDTDVPAEGSWTEHSLLDQLVAELESKEQQPVVSYRGACRWIQTFDQVPLEACGPELVRERGVYLITGGLNDVGFQFAEWLASDAHAAVVLVDPRPLPSREQWEIWPTTHVGEPAAEQMTRIQAWEQGGAKVLISNADVADRNKMRELRDQVHEVWGKIDGVIHAAGFSEREPIASKTRSNIAAVLASKIQGTLVLDEVFAGEDLDFMVFCSSLNSVVGTAEQADYAAANAFLDSLARRNFFRSRCFTMSINWDVWTASDSAVSSVANSASSGDIKPDEAVEVLRRLLRAKPGPQAIISTRDLALVARRKKVDPTEEAASATGRVYARTNLDRPIDPPTNATEALLVPIWTEVLGVSPIGIRDDFFDLGGDSLIGLRMTSRLQDLGIHVSIEQLFRHRTIQELAADIEEGKLSPAGHERPQSSSVLVSIQPQGSRAPLFFVHPIGGHVICYAELSQEMGLEQPFYGLQSPLANCFAESDISIEQMATLYNREIRSVQPVGPYLLSGWSMGGLVAWEMAQQLMKEGETIRLLALMDTTPPSGYLEADDRDDEISMLARFALDMSRLVGKDHRPLVEQFLQAAEQDQWKMVQETLTSYGVLAPKTAHAEMTALLDVFTRNVRAMNNYSIHTSKQSVVFFRASETPERFSRLWTKWSGGGIQFHSVPGDHFTFLRRPNVRIIAETLQRSISMNSNNESRAVSPEMSPRLKGPLASSF